MGGRRDGGASLNCWMVFQQAGTWVSRPTPLPDGTRLGHAINFYISGQIEEMIGASIAATSVICGRLTLWRCGVVARVQEPSRRAS